MKGQETIESNAPGVADRPVTGKAFAVALSKSWQLYRLIKQMRAGVVRFAYEKGRRHAAQGNRHTQRHNATGQGHGPPDDGRTVRYYDVEANGWRSFKSRIS